MALTLLCAAALLLLGGGFGIYRYSARHGSPGLLTLAAEYRTVVFCFALLLLVLLLVGAAAWTSSAPGTFQTSVLQGITGSLAEDLGFFSLLGFIIVLVQRREADMNRNIDDKVELLFSAKKLRSGEVAFLRDEIRKISADCREVAVQIDVVAEDLDNQLVQIDVSRSWLVTNYLASEAAQYTWLLRLTSDDARGHAPSMYVFRSYAVPLTADGNGGWTRSTDHEQLHPGGDVGDEQTLTSDPQVLDIGPDQAREFRTRFRAWQPLFVRDAEPLPDVPGPVVPAADTYRLKFDRHWDEVEISVRNSLQRPLRITISGPGSRSLSLEPGETQARAYRGENLMADSHVYVSFTLL